MRRRSWSVLGAAAVALGCAPLPEPALTPERGPARAAPAPAQGVSVRVIDERRFAQILQGYRGKVVLVDYWATWCLSCRELFPHTVALANRFRDKGLVTISMSLDDPARKATVLQFLQDHRATFDNFLSAYGGSAESMERFHIDNGTLPCYKLYDRQGNLTRTFGGGNPIQPEDMDRAVEQLL